jgi:flagellar basal-body rod modification protein FlgD
MSVSSVTSGTAVGTPTATELEELNSATSAQGGDSSLSESDFLQLLTTQLQNQDPLQPMSDTDFIAQMATFSQLSAQNTLNTNFSDYSSEQALNDAQGYIGKTVTVSGAAEGVPGTTGTVTGVDVSSGLPTITIGGVDYSLTDITAIAPASTTASTTTTPSSTAQPTTTTN